MKKYFFIFSILFFQISLAKINETRKVDVYFFTAKGCTHCKKEKVFLADVSKKYPLDIHELSIEKKENETLLKDIEKKLKINIFGLPATFIGKKYFIGFIDSESTGKNIEKAIIEAKKFNQENIVKNVVENSIKNHINHEQYRIPEFLTLPLIGKVYLKELSLPIITIIFGALDGFNPCAMWSLVMLISLIIPLKSKKKMVLYAGFFIFVSALVYLMFMVAWLNLLMFFKYIRWIKVLVGSIAFLAGIYYLKEFFFNKENVCKVTTSRFKQKVSNRMNSLTDKKNVIIALLGIGILAGLINLIEIVCSAGLPVIYTQILTMNMLSKFQYYMYLILYVFIFMLDDLIIFAAAIYSMNLLNLSSKYARFSKILGGIILVVLGFLLIFKPEALMF